MEERALETPSWGRKRGASKRGDDRAAPRKAQSSWGRGAGKRRSKGGEQGANRKSPAS